MAPRGTVCLVGVAGNQSVPTGPMIVKELSLRGSLVASRRMVEMLEFAEANKVIPATVVYPPTTDGILRAIDAVEKNTIRYRAVIDFTALDD